MTRTQRLQGVCLVLCLWTSAGASTDEMDYSFSLDGKEFRPKSYSIEADGARLKRGDVIAIRGRTLGDRELLLTLGDEKRCHFTTLPDKDGQLFLRTSDGQLKVIGVVIGPRRGGAGGVIFNPLDKMSPDQINGLWGIRIEYWPEHLDEYLTHIDPGSVSLALAGTAFSSSNRQDPFPSLRRDLQYLVVEWPSGNTDTFWLGMFQHLVFLRTINNRADGFDVSPIPQSKGLRYLYIMCSNPKNVDALSKLIQLRTLVFAGATALRDIGFVKEMSSLRVLRIAGAGVSDLSPITHLQSICEVDASELSLVGLPRGDLPSLTLLNIMGSGIKEEELDRFREAHAHCTVYAGWADSLHGTIDKATRLSVLSIVPGQEPVTMFQTTDRSEIARVIGCIDIDDEKSGNIFLDDGYPTLEFYEGDRMLARIDYLRKWGLRWTSGPWRGDGRMTSQGISSLHEWLTEKGALKR